MPAFMSGSLALIGETVVKTGARSHLTLLSGVGGSAAGRHREPDRCLYLAVSDIVDRTDAKRRYWGVRTG